MRRGQELGLGLRLGLGQNERSVLVGVTLLDYYEAASSIPTVKEKGLEVKEGFTFVATRGKRMFCITAMRTYSIPIEGVEESGR